MESFENLLHTSLKEGVVPSLALLAKRRDGSDIITKYLGGKSSSWPNQDTIDGQTLFTLASLTKLPTTIAALQLVEKQLIGLDTDVSDLLPLLGRQPVLSGWNPDGSSILKKREKPITLRHLLTHSSGAGYDFPNSELERFQLFRGATPVHGSTIDKRYDLPLLFEPGQGWSYGCGIDMAGRLVEKLSGMSLDSYLRRHVWEPLGASSFTFWPNKQDAAGIHSAALTQRSETDGRLEEIPGGLYLNKGLEECLGGHAAYSNAPDYMKLLFSLLENNGRTLQPDTVEAMFQGQLSKESRAALQETAKGPMWAVGDYYPEEIYDYGLGGLLIDNSDAPFSRGSKTLVWGGVVNPVWFIDRSNGLCGLFMTQVLPPCDPGVTELLKKFQAFVYQANKDAH